MRIPQTLDLTVALRRLLFEKVAHSFNGCGERKQVTSTTPIHKNVDIRIVRAHCRRRISALKALELGEPIDFNVTINAIYGTIGPFE